MEHQWNENDRGKEKYSGKNVSQCNFVNHKYHMDWIGIEHGSKGQPLTAWAMARYLRLISAEATQAWMFASMQPYTSYFGR
jgi:hypothetical protein